MASRSVPPVTLGTRVRAVRDRRGMTREALAHAAGLSLTTVQALETTDRDPQLSTVVAVADALGVSIDLLVRGEG